ncbi:hypothetical protein VUR80DRAFT_6280 [Thermomyces stellatus]
MLDKAGVEFGCKADDAGCLCANVDFTYGIRDCSLETCEHEAEGVINYGAEYCRSKSRLILAPSPTLVHPLTMPTDEGGVVITTASADPSAGTTAVTPVTGSSGLTETSVGSPENTSNTSGSSSSPDATSETASGATTGIDDDDSTGDDEEGGVARNTAIPADLLAAVGIAAILI